MKELLIISDIHLGTDRRAGTTTITAAQLKEYLFDSFDAILQGHLDKDVLINGDLFDEFTEDDATIKTSFAIIAKWLRDSGNTIHMVFGNHDKSAKGDRLSSFDLLTLVLQEAFPDQVVSYEPELTKVREGVWVIPHCMNSDLFDLELNKALDTLTKGDKLLLHANVMNPFADASDHSLNVTEDMAKQLAAAGIQCLYGHEHQWRCINFEGKRYKHTKDFDPDADIIVMGNQFPSSIADCLGSGVSQTDGRKYAHILDTNNKIRQVVTWDSVGSYISVDWTELDQVGDEQFVRVSGQVDSAQAAQVINLISRFRQRSKALMITNAVKINGASSIDEFGGVSLEEIKTFDVLESLLEELEPAQQKAVKALLED